MNDVSEAIDIWLIPSQGLLPQLALDTLSVEERTRAQAFLSPEHRRQYVHAHVGLREILSLYAEIPAKELIFDAGDYGKPHLRDPGSLRGSFNLSHSPDIAVVAIGSKSRIGVDIERVRPMEWEELAKGMFHPLEIAWIRSNASSRPLEAFFQIWTAKEAYIKALGSGLSHPLDSFTTIGPAKDPGYNIQELDLPAGYAGAVAYPPPEVEIRQAWWNCSQRAPKALARRD